VSQKTSIEWTDATWNPIRGCSRVSEGCRHCYAETIATRFGGPGGAYEGLVRIENGKRRGWSGAIQFVEEHLLDPLRWKSPKRVFVNSMSDLFHENVTDEMRDRVFAVMTLCPQHTFQVLTKRPERMLAYESDGALVARIHRTILELIELRVLSAEVLTRAAEFNNLTPSFPLPNVWLGVSVEDQKAADERIPLLLQTSAAVRFISAEPLLGLVNLTAIHRPNTDWRTFDAFRKSTLDGRASAHLDWVICGGESGAAGRLLDGREWNEFPAAAATPAAEREAVLA
jgi:protein gp37